MWLIAKRDVLDNILSAKFLVGFFLCLVLIPFSVLLNIDAYGDRVLLAQQEQAQAERQLQETRVYSRVRPEIVKPPEALSVFSKGISDQVGHRVRVQLGEKPLLAEGTVQTHDNPLLTAFFSTDFSGVILIVMSLLALIFSYDLCTKEKEDGTLRLQLSNSLSRATLLAGKVLGVLLTLLPILVFCYLLSALIVLVSPRIALSGLEWQRLALLFIASMLLMMCYSMIGLLVSTSRKSSVPSLVICLFIWVLTVFIIPNAATFIASSFVKTESRDNLDAVIADLHKERSDLIREHRKQLPEPDLYLSMWSYSGGDAEYEDYGCTRLYFENVREQAAFTAPLFIDYADKKWPYQRSWWESLQHQRHISERLALLSPAGMFTAITNAVCYADASSQELFMERVRQYRETFIQYFIDQELFTDFRYVTPVEPADMMTADQMIYRLSGGEFRTMNALTEWGSRQADPFAYFGKLRQGDVHGIKPDDFDYLNLDDVPRFQWEHRTVLTGMQTVMVRALALILVTVILFYGAYLAFMRYDVR
ncbi:ABC transporter permease subunit [bacterium]|nr:ABC transporter permease subunit [bacterium]